MKWNLELVYPSIEAWEKDFAYIDEYIKLAESFKGHLGEKEVFLKYLESYREIDKVLGNLYLYASMMNDQNQKEPVSSKLRARIESKWNQVASAVAFTSPELLSLNQETLLSYCSGEYEMFKVMINDLFRNNAYVLDLKGEELLSNFNETMQGYGRMYADLTIKDAKPIPVTLSDGKTIEITAATYTYYLSITPLQEDRKKIFEAYYQSFESNKNTLAAIYKGVMNAEYAESKSRGYASILESHLYGNAIDKEVYLALMDAARNNSEPLKKYIKLRQKYFNLEEYHTYDRFLEFAESDKKYDYESSKKMVLESLEFMGCDFYQKAKLCMSDGRVDVFPADGKRSGAYSTGSYQKGAFILLNHNDNLDSAFTLAHECGHSIHTTYSNQAQPIETSSYRIFVAEVASTFNEARFLDYLMEHITDKNEKIVLLQKAIDNIVSTFYRQALFACYEYEAHKMIEDMIPVDSDALSNIMANLYKDFYDIDLDTEPLKKYVWAYIPHHFYTPFYVYQYATSFSASQAIYADVKNKKEGSFERYINLLKGGCSKYPVELLKDAGVDLTKKETFLAVTNQMAYLVSELEKLLAE